MNYIRKISLNIFYIAFIVLVLTAALRGIPGNPSPETINEQYWRDEGPFELSPERGRFALTYSLIENNSFFYTVPIANFAMPDLGYTNGNYVSLFAPTVSFIVMPGYIIGRFFGLAQVGTFAFIAVFALLNAVLIRLISIRLGAKPAASTIASLVFLFATPAFAYAVSLYQHQVSVFLILLSLYLLFRFNSWLSLSFIWFLCALSLSVDNPNLFMMLPIGIAATGKIIWLKNNVDSVSIHFAPLRLFTFMSIILPLLFFLWFNTMSYGNPLQLPGTVDNAVTVEEEIQRKTAGNVKNEQQFLEQSEQNKSAVQFFQTRNMLNGLYEHIMSTDRGIIMFTPVMFIAAIGSVVLAKKKSTELSVLLGVIGINVLLYSMWGDPYGGWAFGSRYLIPSYAVLAILLALFLTRYGRNTIIMIVFSIVTAYSVWVNTLGAITTNKNPPKVEAVALSNITGRIEKYTYLRNWDYLLSGNSKSFIWQSFLKQYMKPVLYFSFLAGSIILVINILTIQLYRVSRKESNLIS